MLYFFKIIRLQRYGKSHASGLNHQFGEERVPASFGDETMLPGIEEGETLAEVGQSDARTAVVFLVLGEKAVFDAADDVVILLPDVDTDERRLVVAHPVLESILDERDEEQGGDFDRMLRLADIGLEHGMEREADTHQFDVVADEIQLLFQGDTRLATVVEDVAEEAAEVVDGALRLFGAESDEAVDIIQGVEEEMGVELALQVLELGLGAAFFQFAAHGFHLIPVAGHADRDAQSGYQGVKESVAGKEADDVLEVRLPGRAVARRVVGQILHQEVDDHHREGNQKEVGEEELRRPLSQKVALHQTEIVHIEHHHERERHDDEACITFHRNRLRLPAGKKEWHTKKDTPCHRVDDASHANGRITHNSQLIIYSYLIASIGSKSAAFFAGYHPKKTPVTVQTAKERMTLHGWM